MNKLSKNEVNATARGGSELQAEYLQKYVAKELLDQFQIIITRVRELEDKPRLLWCKEVVSEPESQRLKEPAFRDNFRYIIHNSDYQRNQFRDYLGVPFEKSHVLKNAIEPSNIDISKKFFPEKVKLIYSSTPQRGLNILYSVFDELYKDDKNIELNVYSSFDIYGHHERNKPFLPLFDQCKSHPGINYYGSVSHEELKDATKENHILAYPSIWEESSCTTIMENMSAGNLIVTNNLGALPETSAGFSLMYDYQSNLNLHAQNFYNTLKEGIDSIRGNGIGKKINGMSITSLLEEQKKYADIFYNWEFRGQQWTEFLTKLLK